MADQIRIGVDLGGTKIAIAAFSSTGDQIYSKRVSTPKGEYEKTLRLINELVLSAENEIGENASVGLGTPGSISPKTGLLRNSNSTWMNGKPLPRDLEAITGRKLRFANDANCFALSEATDGAAAGCAVVFGVIIGTGTGGGVVVNGNIIEGINGIGGEWGHNPLPWPNDSELPPLTCWCGAENCLELWLSGSGLQRDHKVATGAELSAEEICALAITGEEQSCQTLERHAARLAKSLATVVNLLDPDVIVLGGGLSKLEHLYDKLPVLMEPYVFSDVFETQIKPPKHGDASGVRGAAWLWNP